MTTSQPHQQQGSPDVTLGLTRELRGLMPTDLPQPTRTGELGAIYESTPEGVWELTHTDEGDDIWTDPIEPLAADQSLALAAALVAANTPADDSSANVTSDLAEAVLDIANRLHPLGSDDSMDAAGLSAAESRLRSIAQSIAKLPEGDPSQDEPDAEHCTVDGVVLRDLTAKQLGISAGSRDDEQ